MSTKMHIKSSERGVIRVFHIDLPREAIERFTTQAGTGEWPLQYALGAKSLRNAFVEVVDLRDLGEMSLSNYLAQAHDVSGKDFEALAHQLDALKGHVLVLASQAFNNTEQDLTIAPPLRWIGTFNEPKAANAGAPIQSDAAVGSGGGGKPAGKAKSNAAVWVLIGLFGIIASGIILAKLLVN